MADVFYHTDARKLLAGKHLVFFGDSNTRAIYKDTVCLLTTNSLINENDLRRKQERSFSGDKLGKHSELRQGRDYEEERSFETGYAEDRTRVDFYFITKCYAASVVDMMEDIHLGLREAPDIIYINSTFWDVCRWGPDGVTKFKDNVNQLARLFKSSLPTSTLVIWATALPVSHNVQSSLLIKQIDFLRHSLRFDVMEANQFAREVMGAHGFDILDNHFHMRMQIHRRVKDGIHYIPTAIRLLTNLLLTHIALSWDFPLPNRVHTILLDKAKAMCAPKKRSPSPELNSPQFLRNEPQKRKPLAAKPSSSYDRQQRGKILPRKKFSKIPNGRPNFNRMESPIRSRESSLRPSRVKGVNSRRNWSSDDSNDKRGWPRRNTSPLPTAPANRNGVPVWERDLGNMYSQGNFPANNFTAPNFSEANWSEDYWPDESPSFLGNDQRYMPEPGFLSNSTRYTNDTRFHGYHDDPRTSNNYRQQHPSNNILSEALKQRQIIDKLRQHRYTPY